MPAAKNAPNERSRAWPAPTRKLRLLLPLAYMTAIFALSSIPDTETPANALESALRWASPELQNLLHIPLFGGLAWCWHWGLRSWMKQEQWRLGAALALTLAYAVLDEIHQLYVPGRFGSLTDVVLNAVGAVLALAVIATHQRGKRRDLR
ncbi:MAG: VanZ family protein [Gammaproteobacteria bacterium]|nr:VanZ family protein [Gammaproteobacteria bacterium]